MSQDEPAGKGLDLTLFGEEHVRRYRETGGTEGHEWNGVTCLILTTTGRTSGQPRSTPLIYGRDGDNLIIIASQGGAPSDPQWYKNLTAEPLVTVQVLDSVAPMRARTAVGNERDRLWGIMARLWPNYDTYTQQTDRIIPLVALEPA
jgi:deazaflavin-dependent oxidoreductase (nitroreductase family)